MSHFDEQPVELQVFIYNCVVAASLVVLYYDYVLTLRTEYELYWSKKRRTFSFASVLFFMNRYITLLGHIPVIFLYLSDWPHMNRLDTMTLKHVISCLWINHYNEYMIIVIQVIIGVILIHRTYVLYLCNLKILVVLCCVTIGTIVYGMFSLDRVRETVITVSDLPPSGCLLPVTLPLASRLAEAWMAHLAFDALVFALTMYQSLQRKKNGFLGIMRVIMWDGAMYFAIMILVSISVIVSFYLLPPYIRGLTATMTNTISSTMMSRLMLNLRDAKTKRKEKQRDPDAGGVLSALVFTKSTSDPGLSYHEGVDGREDCDDGSGPFRGHVTAFMRLPLPVQHCDERCTREVLKAMGIDVRELV